MYMVQAWAMGLGFVDCRGPLPREEADSQAAELKAKDHAWMPGTIERFVRVVPEVDGRVYCTQRGEDYFEYLARTERLYKCI